MKKFLSMFLALLLIGTLTIPAFAAQTYEIEDTYHPSWGHKALEHFISISSTSVKKSAQVDVGNFFTSHTYSYKVDSFQSEGSTTLKVGPSPYLSCYVFYANSWNDLRSNKTTYIQSDSGDYSEYFYTLDKPGVYAIEVTFDDIPVKYTFVIEVFTSSAAQKPSTSTTSVPKSFKDVASTRWSHEAIMEMVALGMFSGTTTPDKNGVGTFDPNGTMSRAQFITVVTRHLFGDELDRMEKGATWYTNNYVLAERYGLISEYEFPLSAINEPITREEMAMIAVRTAEAQGETLETPTGMVTIADYASVGRRYKESVRQAFSMGLISGYDDKGTFGPNDTLTREQGAMVAYRLVKPDVRKLPNVIVPDSSTNTDGSITIYESLPSPRPARAGDVYIGIDGSKTVLKIGPNGILGEGQGVAPDKNLTMQYADWTGDRFNFTASKLGNLTDSLGKTLQNQRYLVNFTTGEGHWSNEWQVLMKQYPAPKTRGTYDGQVSTDPHRLYMWSPIGGWVYNN